MPRGRRCSQHELTRKYERRPGWGNASTELRLVAVFRAPHHRLAAGLASGDEAGRMKCMSTFMERITFNPNQCGGRPCIRGMRIRVKDVLDLLAAKVPESEILADYPDLEADDIRACLEYAAAQLDHPVLTLASR